jgi:hypothetical protein
VASDPNGYFEESIDGGRTFRSIGSIKWGNAGEVGWTRGLKTMFPAQILIDPEAADSVWVAQGVGIAKLNMVGSKYEAEDRSAGIEELCAVATLCVPGGKTIFSAWDKSFWRLDDLTAYSNNFRYPLKAGKSHDASLVAYGSYLDFAGDDHRYLVGVIATSDLSSPGFSINGGDGWQAFKGAPDGGWGYGGCIASSTKDNIILLPSNNGIGVFTQDGGKNWSAISLDGTSPTGGFANSYYVARKNITADKTRPGIFALVYTVISNDTYDNPLGGVWLTKNGGKSWTRVLNGVISPGDHNPKAVRAAGLEERQFWQCQLEYVPGRTGELVYTPHADYASDHFYWSRDDGVSWMELHPNIRNVKAFGFGKAAVGQARPALYFWGTVEGKEGLYFSPDWFLTPPRLLSSFPSNLLAKVTSLSGDPDRFGRVFLGTSCAGWILIELEF